MALPRFTTAKDFYEYVEANEATPGFLADLAEGLKVSEERLQAAFITHQATDSPSSLNTLYMMYMDSPATKPTMEELLGKPSEGEEHDIDSLHWRQKARVRQFHREPDPEGLTKHDLAEEFLALQRENPKVWISEEYWMAHARYSVVALRTVMGNIEELRRFAGIKLSRGQQAIQRNIALHNSLDVYRDFYNMEFMPYANQFDFLRGRRGRIRMGATLSDLHDLAVDPYCLAIALDRIKDRQPDVVVLNGDVFDQPEFGRWDCDPRDFRIAERFDFVKKNIFGAVRAAAPSAQIDFVIGNHDWRILKILADKTPNLKVILSDVMGLTLEDIFGVNAYQINLISKGGLDFTANGKKAIENQCRQNFAMYFDQAGNPMYIANHFGKGRFTKSGTSGHVHKQDIIPWNSENMEHSWMVTAAMAKTRAHYVEGLDQAQNGFGFFHMDTKLGHTQNEYIDCSGESTHIDGRYYYRTGDPNDQVIREQLVIPA